MKLEKVHRCLRFKQAPFIASYIDLMTQKRKEAKTKVQISLFKSLSNNNYGRSVQKVRDLLDCHLVKTEWYLTFLVSLPNFHSMKIVDEGLVIVYMRQVSCKMNKPYIIGIQQSYNLFQFFECLIIKSWFFKSRVNNSRIIKIAHDNRMALFYHEEI